MAKLADHIVAICEKYYERLDMAVKTKGLTDLNLERVVVELMNLCSMYD